MRAELKNGKAGGHQACNQLHLTLVIAVELESHLRPRLVNGGDAGLLEEASLEGGIRPCQADCQDAPLPGTVEDLLHGAAGQNPAAVDYGDAIAHLGELGEDVRAEENRLAVEIGRAHV